MAKSPQHKTGLNIRQMRRDELNTLIEWAAAEGWNPGLSDADIFWATDPESFIAAELAGQPIGGGSIVNYAGKYGFMGFFIVHPAHRSRGLGKQLWDERLRRLINRLDKPVMIGMDGVFDMQAFYAKGGFEFAARDLRFEGRGKLLPIAQGIVELSDVPFASIYSYDQAHFPAPRPVFLKQWINQTGVFAKAALRNNELIGYAMMRPCRIGYKIGPLFAKNAVVANDLFCALSAQIPGETIFLDVPENNPAAIALAKQHNMAEVFGCAKMYYGSKPELPEQEIFGVTSFEFG